MKNVTVLGAGHWGLALAHVLASNKHNVLVYGRNEQDMNQINQIHKSKYFKDKILDLNIKATSNILEAFDFSDIIVIALPVTTIISNLKDLVLKNTNKTYLFTSKGLFNGKSMSLNFNDLAKNLNLAVLSGPSFSEEVMDNKYTAVVIASNKDEIALNLQKLFMNDFFRVYTSNDLVGVEYCGAIKNVFAIVCGMIDGNNMGANTKNAMITRAMSEMEHVINLVGGNIKTLHGLAGVGDIMLTCNSFESRNYSFGFNYARNTENQNNGIIEGLNTIKEIYQIAKENNLELPIVNAVYNILVNKSTIDKEAKILMGRNMKSE